MSAALARHDHLLLQAVSVNRGAVFAKGGDGMAVVFGRAGDAIAAAVAAQRAFEIEPWPTALRVRMGVHTGEAEERGGDYFGPAVNRAARLMSEATGGQVLVSLSTAEVVRDRLPEGLTLVELGERNLRSLTRPERVFELIWSADREPLPESCATAAGRDADSLGSHRPGCRARRHHRHGGGGAPRHAGWTRWGREDHAGHGGGATGSNGPRDGRRDPHVGHGPHGAGRRAGQRARTTGEHRRSTVGRSCAARVTTMARRDRQLRAPPARGPRPGRDVVAPLPRADHPCHQPRAAGAAVRTGLPGRTAGAARLRPGRGSRQRAIRRPLRGAGATGAPGLRDRRSGRRHRHGGAPAGRHAARHRAGRGTTVVAQPRRSRPPVGPSPGRSVRGRPCRPAPRDTARRHRMVLQPPPG